MSDKKTVGAKRTKKRAFIHAFMVNYQRQNNGVAPSLSTIAKHFECGKTSVYSMLMRMANDGSVRYDYGYKPAFTAIATPAVNIGAWECSVPQDETGGQK